MGALLKPLFRYILSVLLKPLTTVGLVGIEWFHVSSFQGVGIEGFHVSSFQGVGIEWFYVSSFQGVGIERFNVSSFERVGIEGFHVSSFQGVGIEGFHVSSFLVGQNRRVPCVFHVHVFYPASLVKVA